VPPREAQACHADRHRDATQGGTEVSTELLKRTSHGTAEGSRGEECRGEEGRGTDLEIPLPHPSSPFHFEDESPFGESVVEADAVEDAAVVEAELSEEKQLPAVRAMFGDAVRDGLIPTNPFSGLRLPGGEGRKHIVALTEPDLVALADLALDPRMELGAFAPEYRALVLFAGYVGLRPGELFALRRDRVHGQLATIERSLSSKTRQIGPTKTGRPRTVIIPPAAQDALLDVPEHPSGLLFETPAGRMWNQVSHHRYWTRLRLLANKPGFHFYELRHAAATMLLERGVTPWDVAIQLGHTDGGQLVMGLYGHPSEAGSRARLLAAWDAQDGPTPIEAIGRKAGATRA
jgi:integrase